MWDLPGPGLEPVSPALAGGFLTTAPPEKPCFCSMFWFFGPEACRISAPRPGLESKPPALEGGPPGKSLG